MEGFDWWSRYYASVKDNYDETDLYKSGLSLIKVSGWFPKVLKIDQLL